MIQQENKGVPPLEKVDKGNSYFSCLNNFKPEWKLTICCTFFIGIIVGLIILIKEVQLIVINEKFFLQCPGNPVFYTQSNVSFSKVYNDFGLFQKISYIESGESLGQISGFVSSATNQQIDHNFLQNAQGVGRINQGDLGTCFYFPESEQNLLNLFGCVPEFRHISVRGGGYSVQGTSVLGDIVVSLENLDNQDFKYGPSIQEANGFIEFKVPASMRMAEVYKFLKNNKEDLLFPGGLEPGISIGGFTLGAGHSLFTQYTGSLAQYLSKVRIALPHDNTEKNINKGLQSLVKDIDDTSDPELMKSLRGAGQNLGIVLSLTFRFEASRMLASDLTVKVYQSDYDLSGKDIKQILEQWDARSQTQIGLGQIEISKNANQLNQVVRVWTFSGTLFGTTQTAIDSQVDFILPKKYTPCPTYTFPSTKWVNIYFDTVNIACQIQPFNTFTTKFAQQQPAKNEYLVDLAYDSWVSQGVKTRLNESDINSPLTSIITNELPQKMVLVNYKMIAGKFDNNFPPNRGKSIFEPVATDNTKPLYVAYAYDQDVGKVIYPQNSIFRTEKGLEYPNYPQTVKHLTPYKVFGQELAKMVYSTRKLYDSNNILSNPFRLL